MKRQHSEWDMLKDLQSKISALIDFVARECSYDKYHDDFYIYIDKTNSSLLPKEETTLTPKDILVVWYCKKFMSDKNDRVDDERDHEKILCHHFKDFDVLIEKTDLSWRINISTPVQSPPAKKVCVLAPIKDQ